MFHNTKFLKKKKKYWISKLFAFTIINEIKNMTRHIFP